MIKWTVTDLSFRPQVARVFNSTRLMVSSTQRGLTRLSHVLFFFFFSFSFSGDLIPDQYCYYKRYNKLRKRNHYNNYHLSDPTQLYDLNRFKIYIYIYIVLIFGKTVYFEVNFY
jgi:hypothetical protein